MSEPLMGRPIVARGLALLSLLHKIRRSWMRRSPAARTFESWRAGFYDAIWQEAALAVRASVTRVGDGVLAIEIGGRQLRVSANTTSLDDPVTLRMAGDKPLVHRLLTNEGIPVPRHVACRGNDLAAAWSFVTQLEGPVVVKPARSTGAGNGVTSGVVGRFDLIRAMGLAGAFCDEVVLEQQLQGDNYRLLYFDGELLDAVLRSPPALSADGRSSIAKLIRDENRARLRDGITASHTLIGVDQELRKTLREQGYALRSVPPSGRRLWLKAVVSENRSTDNTAAHDMLCDSVVQSGAAAARAVGVSLAGVDLITPDGSRSLREAGGAIIEVNTSPGFHYHYMSDSAPVHVATAILERLAVKLG